MCNDIVRGVTATFAAAAELAETVAKEAADLAEAAADLADVFMGEVLKLGDQIQCAAPLPPKGRAPASMAPHVSRAALWYTCATCRRVEPGATWQECL